MRPVLSAHCFLGALVFSVALVLALHPLPVQPLKNDILDCRTTANLFANTCDLSKPTPDSVAVLPSKPVACKDVDVVQIRIQTNGLPTHCYYSATSFSAVTIDITVDWNVLYHTAGPPVNDVTTSTQLTAKVCDTKALSLLNIPSTIKWTDNSGMQSSLLNTVNKNSPSAATLLTNVGGIAVNGVPYMSAVLKAGSDDIYDDIFAQRTSSFYNKPVPMDTCLGIVTWNTYHYTLMSPCLYLNSTMITAPQTLCTSNCNITAGANGLQKWAPSQYPVVQTGLNGYDLNKNLWSAGISFDGHVIYGPYGINTLLTTTYDTCNGYIWGSYDYSFQNTKLADYVYWYSYILTPSFPYFMGCYGPGSIWNPSQKPERLLPACTSNPAPYYYSMSGGWWPHCSVLSVAAFVVIALSFY